MYLTVLLIKEIQHVSSRVCEKNCVDKEHNKSEFYQHVKGKIKWSLYVKGF